MATLLWLIPCRRIIIDSETNLVSYIDVLNGFRVSQLPAQFPTIMVGSVWEAEPGDVLESRFRFVGPDGKVLREFEFPSHTFSSRRHRQNLQIGGFTVSAEGRYRIAFEQKENGSWAVAGSMGFPIELREEEDEEGGEANAGGE